MTINVGDRVIASIDSPVARRFTTAQNVAVVTSITETGRYRIHYGAVGQWCRLSHLTKVGSKRKKFKDWINEVQAR